MDNFNFHVNGKFIPREVTAYILNLVEPGDILNCRRVCSLWHEIIDNELWKKKFGQETKLKSFSRLTVKQRRQLFNLPWPVYYSLFAHDPFERNLFPNDQEINKRISVLAPWSVVNKPEDVHFPLCDDQENTQKWYLSKKKCYYNAMRYAVEFSDYGFSNILIDHLRPKIIVSVWFATTIDVEAELYIGVYIFGENNGIFHRGKSVKLNKNWKKVQIEIEDYPPRMKRLATVFNAFRRADVQYITGPMIKLSFSNISHLKWNTPYSSVKIYWGPKFAGRNLNDISLPLQINDSFVSVWNTLGILWLDQVHSQRIRNTDNHTDIFQIEKSFYFVGKICTIYSLPFGSYNFIVDIIQPKIEVNIKPLETQNSLYSKGLYKLKSDKWNPSISLLDKNKQPILSSKFGSSNADIKVKQESTQVNCIFKNYGPGVRYVKVKLKNPNLTDQGGKAYDLTLMSTLRIHL